MKKYYLLRILSSGNSSTPRSWHLLGRKDLPGDRSARWLEWADLLGLPLVEETVKESFDNPEFALRHAKSLGCGVINPRRMGSWRKGALPDDFDETSKL